MSDAISLMGLSGLMRHTANKTTTHNCLSLFLCHFCHLALMLWLDLVDDDDDDDDDDSSFAIACRTRRRPTPCLTRSR
jgi:hypothetical protein